MKKLFGIIVWLPSEYPRNHKIIKSKSSTQKNIQKKHISSHLFKQLSPENSEFKPKTNIEHRWIRKSDIDSFGMPAPIKKIILRRIKIYSVKNLKKICQLFKYRQCLELEGKS